MRKIAIIGAHKPSLKNLPFKEKGWEIWSINNLFLMEELQNHLNKFTRWFELHKFQKKKNIYLRRGAKHYQTFPSIKEYMEGLDNLDSPIFMQKKWDNIKKSEVFPFKKIMEFFNSSENFGCSFAWLIAFALYEHLHNKKEISQIGLWGVDLSGQEYYAQRPSTEYWIGRAQGLGISVTIEQPSSLLKHPFIYAYKENFNFINGAFIELGVIEQSIVSYVLYLQDMLEKKYYG